MLKKIISSVIFVFLGLLITLPSFAATSGKLFVAAEGTDNVAVIDAQTNTWITNIDMGAGSTPHNPVVSPDNQYVWVTLKGTGEVAKIRVSDNTLVGTYSTGGASPVHLDISPDGNWVYIVNQGSDQVVRMDTSTGVLDSTSYTFGGSPSPNYTPHDINIGPDGKVWVTDETKDWVTLLDTSLTGVFTTIDVGDRPIQVAFSVDGTQAFTTNYDDNTVSVLKVGDGINTGTYGIDTTSFVMSDSGLMGPMGAVVDPDGEGLWLSGTSGNTVHRHSLLTGDNYSYTETTGLLEAHGLDISDDGDFVYTTVRSGSSSRNAIAVIDTSTGLYTTVLTPGANDLHGVAYVVPVPAAFWLFGSGLLGLVGFARRKSDS